MIKFDQDSEKYGINITSPDVPYINLIMTKLLVFERWIFCLINYKILSWGSEDFFRDKDRKCLY